MCSEIRTEPPPPPSDRCVGRGVRVSEGTQAGVPSPPCVPPAPARGVHFSRGDGCPVEVEWLYGFEIVNLRKCGVPDS